MMGQTKNRNLVLQVGGCAHWLVTLLRNNKYLLTLHNNTNPDGIHYDNQKRNEGLEETWDVQERDGHCEVGTGQKPNSWKEDDANDDDDNDDDDDQIIFCGIKGRGCGCFSTGIWEGIWAEEKGRDRMVRNRPIR
jgi:hypothetical protein